MIPDGYTKLHEAAIIAEAQQFESAAGMSDSRLISEARYLASRFRVLTASGSPADRRASFEAMRGLAAVISEIQARGIDG